jgi:hypothetical protein
MASSTFYCWIVILFWRFHIKNGTFKKICERFCIFPSEVFGKNFNISENSIISVEGAKALQ